MGRQPERVAAAGTAVPVTCMHENGDATVILSRRGLLLYLGLLVAWQAGAQWMEACTGKRQPGMVTAHAHAGLQSAAARPLPR